MHSVLRVLAATTAIWCVAAMPSAASRAETAPIPVDPATIDPASGIPQAVADNVTQAVGQVQLAMWSGTGWVAEPQVVITNFHVSRAGSSTVKFTPSNGSAVECWVAAADRAADLAALRCPDLGRRPLPVARRSAVVGEPVIVVGYPGGIGPTATTGVITEASREVRRTDSLGFSAAIEPGSSGSPVVSAEGDVLAVATFSGGYGSKADKLVEVVERDASAADTFGGAAVRLWLIRCVVLSGVFGSIGAWTGWRSGTGRTRFRLVAGILLAVTLVSFVTGLQILIDGPTKMIT